MKNPDLKSVIKQAIKNEEGAYEFYSNLERTVEDPLAKETLAFLAQEEQKHKEFLLGYLAGEKNNAALPLSQVIDYHVAEYTTKPDIKKNMNSAEVYLVAAHRELNSYNFYSQLAAIQPQGGVKEMLLLMAQQEMQHKEKVEYLYSNTAFPQTAGG